MVYVVLRGHVYLRKSGAMGRFTAQMAAMSPSPAVFSKKNHRPATNCLKLSPSHSLTDVTQRDVCEFFCHHRWCWSMLHFLQDESAHWTTAAAVTCVLMKPGVHCVPVLPGTSSLPTEPSVKVCVLVCSKNITHRSLLVILNLKSHLKQLITAL